MQYIARGGDLGIRRPVSYCHGHFGVSVMNPLWTEILQPEVLLALALPVAIVMGGIVGIATLVIQHRERMAKIEHGIDPDAAKSGQKTFK
jgi:hypothetical protein